MNLRMRESKSRALPLGDTPLKVTNELSPSKPEKRGWMMGIEPTHVGATIRCVTTSPHPPHHVPGGIRTPDPRLRRPMLYPTELLAHIGAGDGNRTHVAGLEGQNSTIELHPQHCQKESRGGGIRTPGPMVPNHVLYQTEPHPDVFLSDNEIYSIRFF